jgi:hypothetical protein
MANASSKQIAFVERLIAERQVPATDVANLAAILDGSATTKAASDQITRLLGYPKKATPVAAEVVPGYYYRSTDDAYLVVVKTKDGQRSYGKILEFVEATDGSMRPRWAYAPGAKATLVGLAPMTAEQAASLGHMHGYCVICTQRLTDAESVQRGIGPVCIKRLLG